ncbi:MAG: phycobilisome protein [Pseudanabaenaceae cyanobacterium SKYGB_i_bin29]|nr:phycobilisome protein [Pseudanabaenaceae cyanobacterium SKYG29]MDW8421113.1 phycobilisome protein [Pseudanabaenaceae cyanobacterium SKYGB_i_bin29]
MITLWEEVLKVADGKYAQPEDLRMIDRAVSTWEQRKQVYHLLEQKENEIVQMAAQLMQKTDRFQHHPMDKLGVERCQRDMVMGLRACALAMLLQDEYLLKDRVLYWQRNVFLAMQLSYQGYKCLLQAVKSLLPESQAAFIAPYLQIAHEMMSGK